MGWAWWESDFLERKRERESESEIEGECELDFWTYGV